jgi:hypothetical protein
MQTGSKRRLHRLLAPKAACAHRLCLRLRGGGKKNDGFKKSKVARATKDEVLARVSKVMTNSIDTSIGSLTRLMVKTYNDAQEANGSGKSIEFTDFGDHPAENMMRVFKPLRKSTSGECPPKCPAPRKG